jgi:hypothetical protein
MEKTKSAYNDNKRHESLVSNFTKFWMCQKCGKMKDYNEKITSSEE